MQRTKKNPTTPPWIGAPHLIQASFHLITGKWQFDVLAGTFSLYAVPECQPYLKGSETQVSFEVKEKQTEPT